ncbi:MAG: hypothetical protein U9R25_14225 [Chloroflexota bacterium]|nr:hypothetical protein [Chloroflexota bacterium]
MTLFRFETPPSASMNRVRIMDLPGLPLDDAVRDRRGDELISNRALMALAAEYAEALGLRRDSLIGRTPQLTQSDVFLRDQAARMVQEALSGPEGEARAAAESIARRLGRNLGWLLVALHRGDRCNRSVRPDWHARDWERWSAVRTVWLGGGLSIGQLGDLIAEEAQTLLRAMHCGVITVKLSPYRDLVALVGAGRTVPVALMDRQRTVLCLDFGHTLVKRAGLIFRDGVMVGLEPLAPRLADWQQILGQAEASEAVGFRVLNFVARTIAEALSELPQTEPAAIVSIAAYRQQGRLVGNGPYATIHAAGGQASAETIIGDAVGQRTGHHPTVRVIHDGTAASLAHAGTPDSAILMLGTALGVGFPSGETGGLCPVAPDLVPAQA